MYTGKYIRFLNVPYILESFLHRYTGYILFMVLLSIYNVLTILDAEEEWPFFLVLSLDAI
jgi:hypothetical protein